MLLLSELIKFMGKITIELIYALPNEQELITIQVEESTQIKEAIIISGILEKYPEINLSNNPVGIFSQKVSLDSKIRQGDRIEIYRPLKIDPKEARRKRVTKK